MKQFFSFVEKEFYHVFRDRKTLLLLFGLPVVQIILFGFALTNEIKNTRIVVCDFAKDQATYRITSMLEANTSFTIERSVLNYNQLHDELKKGKIKLAVVFPAGFNNALQHQHKAQVQILADASDPNNATAVINYASAIIYDYQNEVLSQQPLPYRINILTRMLYNPELKGSTNFIPGVMALVLLLICVLMTSVSIVREKERGTMEVLLVSPFHPLLVIISKMLPYFVLSLINLVVILLLSVYLLDTPVKGNVFLLVAESALFIVTSLSLGLMISNVTASQQTAMIIALLGTMLPTVLFTGFMFPIENMPLLLQFISNLVPSRWYYIIVKDIMIKGLGFSSVWKETIILFVMAVLLMIISLKKFKLRLA